MQMWDIGMFFFDKVLEIFLMDYSLSFSVPSTPENICVEGFFGLLKNPLRVCQPLVFFSFTKDKKTKCSVLIYHFKCIYNNHVTPTTHNGES